MFKTNKYFISEAHVWNTLLYSELNPSAFRFDHFYCIKVKLRLLLTAQRGFLWSRSTDWLWNSKWNSAFITFLSNVKESFTQTGGDDRNSRQVWEQLCPHGLCPCRRLKTPRHFLFFTSATHCICVFAPEVCLWRLVCSTFCSPASMFLRVTSLYNTSMIEW